MKDSSIVVVEAVIVTNNSPEKLVILSKISCSGQEPAIPELALLHVKPRKSFLEEQRTSSIIANLRRSLPLVITFSLLRVEQAFVRCWKFWILK